ncbi:MAG: L,D-transpeptidase family protein, partial [Burkholderiales bacterium]|nr:L,D-transpeptidase family protein [Burkholderiales bacterium]
MIKVQGLAMPISTLRAGMVNRLWLLAWAVAASLAPAATYVLPTNHDTVVGDVHVVQVHGDSTLLDVMRHYDVGYDEIVSANPSVSVWTPDTAAQVVVPSKYALPPKPWAGIVINIPQRRLFYFPAAKHHEQPVVMTYPISIAREGWATPLGETRVIAKYRDPAWFVPDSIRAEHLREEGVELPEYFPPGPDNPMGMLALQTGFPGIYIHA